MQPFRYTRAPDLATAIQLVSGDPQAAFIAGGTELVNLMREGQASPAHLIDIGGLPLADIEVRDDGVRIGALSRGAAREPAIRERYPVLVQALASGASPQIRNMVTPGGNLLQKVRCPYYRDISFPCNRRDAGSGCPAITGENRTHAIFGGSEQCIAIHPSDLAVALLALDAVVLTMGPAGERQIPIEAFHLLPGDTPAHEHVMEPGELIVAIELPATPFAARSHYLKLRDRASFTFALVSVAVALELDGTTVRSARVALGGVAPKPWRTRAAEEALVGRVLDDRSVAAAADAAVAGATPQTQNGYKIELTRRAVARALTTLGGR
jgi:xanthine dehydrogenase YagS FAD-binding subunit